jgi:TPR repeat protein
MRSLDPPRIAAIPGVTLDVVVVGPAVVASPPPSALNQIAQQAAQFPKYDPLSALPSHPLTPTSHFTTGNNIPRIFNHHREPVLLTSRRQPNDTATRTHKRALELNKVKAIIRKIAACTDLDALHAKGDGRSQDFRKALECYLKTVQKGQAQALISVGELFLHGQAVQQSPIIAMGWYLKAAYLGDNNARYKIDQLRL